MKKMTQFLMMCALSCKVFAAENQDELSQRVNAITDAKWVSWQYWLYTQEGKNSDVCRRISDAFVAAAKQGSVSVDDEKFLQLCRHNGLVPQNGLELLNRIDNQRAQEEKDRKEAEEALKREEESKKPIRSQVVTKVVGVLTPGENESQSSATTPDSVEEQFAEFEREFEKALDESGL